MCVCEYMTLLYRCLQWPVEGVGILRVEVTDVCELSNCEYWVLNFGALEEQEPFLTTEELNEMWCFGVCILYRIIIW